MRQNERTIALLFETCYKANPVSMTIEREGTRTPSCRAFVLRSETKTDLKLSELKEVSERTFIVERPDPTVKPRRGDQLNVDTNGISSKWTILSESDEPAVELWVGCSKFLKISGKAITNG